jgi:type I restriction enzyme M protein
VLFRGNVEAAIRRNLIRRGLIKGIIGLPANLFYGTGIPACILVIDKEHAASRIGIFMIDASKGFIKDGNKNRLRERDLHKIVDIFTSQAELPRYARMVTFGEIENNDYNLNIPRYIDSSEPEDLHDLNAHLNGGIPDRDIDALQNYWQIFPTLRQTLFSPLPPGEGPGVRESRKGYSTALIKASQVKATILEHPEFESFREQVLNRFRTWQETHLPNLKALLPGSDPKALISELSEKLLKQFADAPLVDNYAIYQHLMDYWFDIMQDDVYAIAQDGWLDAARPRELVVEKGKKLTETPDLVISKKKYKTDLIPPALTIARYFGGEQATIDDLQAKADAVAQALETFIEENSGEEDLLEEAKTDKGKITKASLKARINEIRKSPVIPAKAGIQESNDELATLQKCQKFIDAEAAASKQVKEAQKALDEKVFVHYPKLSADEIKQLVVKDKWLAAIEADVQAEIERVTQSLTARIKTLEERYAEPLPAILNEVTELSAHVDEHLKSMGLEWRTGV